MGSAHTPADDIFYDLVAIQYHALKGAQVYDQYAKDASEHDDVRSFIAEVKEQDANRALRAHELLGQLTSEHAGGMG